MRGILCLSHVEVIEFLFLLSNPMTSLASFDLLSGGGVALETGGFWFEPDSREFERGFHAALLGLRNDEGLVF